MANALLALGGVAAAVGAGAWFLQEREEQLPAQCHGVVIDVRGWSPPRLCIDEERSSASEATAVRLRAWEWNELVSLAPSAHHGSCMVDGRRLHVLATTQPQASRVLEMYRTYGAACSPQVVPAVIDNVLHAHLQEEKDQEREEEREEEEEVGGVGAAQQAEVAAAMQEELRGFCLELKEVSFFAVTPEVEDAIAEDLLAINTLLYDLRCVAASPRRIA